MAKGLTEVLLQEKKLYKPRDSFVKKANVKQWKATLKKAAKDPLKYWEEAANELEWYSGWTKVFDKSKAPFFKWFIGGKCNIVANAIDRHLGTETEKKTAIAWENDAGKREKLTYGQLNKKICKFANALKQLNIKKGDRVAIYLQNTPEIAIAMLACAKIGAVHSVIYAGYSAHAIRERVDDQKAKLVITSDVGYRRGKEIDMKSVVDDALKGSHSVQNVVLIKRGSKQPNMKANRDLFYEAITETQSDKCDTVPLDAEDPLFILYTSGSTGKPKGVVHVHGGYMVGVYRSLSYTLDLKPDDIYWCTADPGWITGHSYIVYGPLMHGVTTLMFEGAPDHPKPDKLWKIVDKYKVSIFYTAPTLVRALMRYGDKWVEKNSLKSLRLLGSVGEPINPEAWRWYHKVVGKKRCPVVDTWWQTETGMFMIAPLPVMPLKAGSATYPVPGIEAKVVDEKGKKVPVGKGGFLVITTPWPSMMRTVFNDPQRYIDSYWKKLPGDNYVTGDMAHVDKDGYFWIQGRSDDVLKIAGHRIGSAEIESAIVSYKGVSEAAVIGIPDEIKGEKAKAFVILKKGTKAGDDLVDKLKKHVRKELGPIAVMDEVAFVDKLPKTRSGKIMRRILRAKELGEDLGDTSGLAD